MAKKTRRKYTDEFKAVAVKLIVEEGYSTSQAARNLQINNKVLTRWKYKLTDSASQRSPVLCWTDYFTVCMLSRSGGKLPAQKNRAKWTEVRRELTYIDRGVGQ